MNRSNRLAILLFAVVIHCVWAPAERCRAEMEFTNVTRAAGFRFFLQLYGESSMEVIGGLVAEDFNGDGWIDVFLAQSTPAMPSALYINKQNGTFADEAAARGATLMAAGHGAAGADFDNDGDIDLCVAVGEPPHVLLINDGTGKFAAQKTWLTLPDGALATCPSWGDTDGDGFLELALGRWAYEGDANLWLYRRSAEGGLQPFALGLGEREQSRILHHVFSPRFADATGDGRADLFIVIDGLGAKLYVNTGETLQDQSEARGVGLIGADMGITTGDYDNDGDMDAFVASQGTRLYRNRGDGKFDDVAAQAGVYVDSWSWGCSFGDLDLDGDLDLYSVNGYTLSMDVDRTHLFKNQGDGTFVDIAPQLGMNDITLGRGVALFDFDNDGDLDIFVTNYPSMGDTQAFPMLYRNNTFSTFGWLKVELSGQPPFHRDGIGSRVLIATEGKSQMRELHASTNYMGQEPGRIAHFGLGAAAAVQEARAEWVGGDAVAVLNVAKNQTLTLPSPTAVAEPRKAAVGELVTASAAGVAPAGAQRKWLIEGKTYTSATLQIAFESEGKKDLVLDIYEPDGKTVLRREILRVEVADPPTSTEDWRRYR